LCIRAAAPRGRLLSPSAAMLNAEPQARPYMVVHTNPKGVHFRPISPGEAKRAYAGKVIGIQAYKLILAFNRPSRANRIFDAPAKHVAALRLRYIERNTKTIAASEKSALRLNLTKGKPSREVNQGWAHGIAHTPAHGTKPIETAFHTRIANNGAVGDA